MDTHFSLTVGDMDITVLFIGIYPPNMLLPSRLHEHLNFEVHSALTGQITYTTEAECFVLDSSSLLIIPPHMLHSSTINEGNTLLLSFEFSVSKKKRCADSLYSCFLELMDNKLSSPRFIYSPVPEISELKKLVQTEYKKGSPHEKIAASLIKSYINIIISKMMLELLQSGSAQNHVHTKKHPPLESASPQVAYISQYIFANYNSSPSVKELASIMHLSVRQIERIIKNEMNSSFSELLNKYRIKLATHIIRTHSGNKTAPSFSKVAASVGFESYYTFLKQFKIYTGTTPSEYFESISSQKSIATQ